MNYFLRKFKEAKPVALDNKRTIGLIAHLSQFMLITQGLVTPWQIVLFGKSLNLSEPVYISSFDKATIKQDKNSVERFVPPAVRLHIKIGMHRFDIYFVRIHLVVLFNIFLILLTAADGSHFGFWMVN